MMGNVALISLTNNNDETIVSSITKIFAHHSIVSSGAKKLIR